MGLLKNLSIFVFSETEPNFSIEKSIEIYRKSRIRDLICSICIEFSIEKLGSVSEKTKIDKSFSRHISELPANF